MEGEEGWGGGEREGGRGRGLSWGRSVSWRGVLGSDMSSAGLPNVRVQNFAIVFPSPAQRLLVEFRWCFRRPGCPRIHSKFSKLFWAMFFFLTASVQLMFLRFVLTIKNVFGHFVRFFFVFLILGKCCFIICFQSFQFFLLTTDGKSWKFVSVFFNFDLVLDIFELSHVIRFLAKTN